MVLKKENTLSADGFGQPESPGAFPAAPRGYAGIGKFHKAVGVGFGPHSSLVAAAGTASLAGGKASVSLWYDHLSGDDRLGDGETGAFSTLFAARHRYYGRGDYFRDIPQDTGSLGLRDAAIKLAAIPTPLLRLNLDFHTFRTTECGSLSSRHLAEEIDLWVSYRFREVMNLEAGYSLTWAGTAMEELGRLEGTGHMTYLMTSVLF